MLFSSWRVRSLAYARMEIFRSSKCFDRIACSLCVIMQFAIGSCTAVEPTNGARCTKDSFWPALMIIRFGCELSRPIDFWSELNRLYFRHNSLNFGRSCHTTRVTEYSCVPSAVCMSWWSSSRLLALRRLRLSTNPQVKSIEMLPEMDHIQMIRMQSSRQQYD